MLPLRPRRMWSRRRHRRPSDEGAGDARGNAFPSAQKETEWLAVSGVRICRRKQCLVEKMRWTRDSIWELNRLRSSLS